MEPVINKGEDNNLDVPYVTLRKYFNDSLHSADIDIDGCGERSGIVITHGYPQALVDELGSNYFRTNFFKPDVIKPAFIKVEQPEYSWDDWGFDNGYSIHSLVSDNGTICLLDPTDDDTVDVDQSTLDFTNGLIYFFTTIDMLSYKYLFDDQEDVPFGLLQEILEGSSREYPGAKDEFPNDVRSKLKSIDLTSTLTKRQVIAEVRAVFADVAKHLATYYD
jgi:hypothetical protein